MTEDEMRDGHEGRLDPREDKPADRGTEKLQKDTDLLFTPDEVLEIVESSRFPSPGEEHSEAVGSDESFVVPARLATLEQPSSHLLA